MEELRLEIEALLSQTAPAPDLGLCFSYSIAEEPYHTRLTQVTTYEEILTILEEMGLELI